ncbi:THUMP domain protein [Methanothermus fervidus DSM 2088]|uniref:THUMP domain protein n=1 Tax=Methanothermus fervidus (strain ATCC 43054 / DSM 2088 / JCM 10308 / V24 S) TaxID=523846 RepID=E3GXT2_METFV|nr:THUMP domain-containing protein [Methanothermus fervidus]ADP77114.1 THUMP domain protein [Methanothermus fervidus DSM 2088]
MVTFAGRKGEEIVGSEEIELLLKDYEPVLDIKESNFPNLLLINLTMDPKLAVKIIANANLPNISKIIPIEAVVKTNINSIVNKVVNLCRKKVKANDTFSVRCDLRGSEINKDEVVEKVEEALTDELNLIPDKNGKWVIQIEIVGKITGISVLKPDEFFKAKS